jgi:hypothetical protein
VTRLLRFVGLLAILSVHLTPDASFAKSKRILVFGDYMGFEASNCRPASHQIAGQRVLGR